jgi:hypothetical protein
MPASMMSAPTGGKPKVIGSSMATWRWCQCPEHADQRADQRADQAKTEIDG